MSGEEDLKEIRLPKTAVLKKNISAIADKIKETTNTVWPDRNPKAANISRGLTTQDEQLIKEEIDLYLSQGINSADEKMKQAIAKEIQHLSKPDHDYVMALLNRKDIRLLMQELGNRKSRAPPYFLWYKSQNRFLLTRFQEYECQPFILLRYALLILLIRYNRIDLLRRIISHEEKHIKGPFPEPEHGQDVESILDQLDSLIINDFFDKNINLKLGLGKEGLKKNINSLRKAIAEFSEIKEVVTDISGAREELINPTIKEWQRAISKLNTLLVAAELIDWLNTPTGTIPYDALNSFLEFYPEFKKPGFNYTYKELKILLYWAGYASEENFDFNDAPESYRQAVKSFQWAIERGFIDKEKAQAAFRRFREDAFGVRASRMYKNPDPEKQKAIDERIKRCEEFLEMIFELRQDAHPSPTANFACIRRLEGIMLHGRIEETIKAYTGRKELYEKILQDWELNELWIRATYLSELETASTFLFLNRLRQENLSREDRRFLQRLGVKTGQAVRLYGKVERKSISAIFMPLYTNCPINLNTLLSWYLTKPAENPAQSI